jgi:hypothetical protein
LRLLNEKLLNAWTKIKIKITAIMDNIKMDLRLRGRVWIGFIWLRIGTGDGLLCTR